MAHTDMNMRRFSLLLSLILLACACSSGRGGSSGTTAVPGHGALSVAVLPNPIMATRVSGDIYDFPFEAVIRETGGAPVTIQRVMLTVSAFGGFPVYSETFGPSEIAQRGFPSSLPAGGELRYKFNPRKEVGDDRLFSAVSAELRIEGVDPAGVLTTATTNVTVRR